jgi:hypothetical protein
MVVAHFFVTAIRFQKSTSKGYRGILQIYKQVQPKITGLVEPGRIIGENIKQRFVVNRKAFLLK